MLHPPSRPRAPSTATLRILYQLAYISSGTALGVGALCAEERRRRTQVVQKVADNARRLRQSPRYAHAAAVRLAQEDGGDEMAWWGAEGAVKGEEMPSVVQKGYERYERGSEVGVKGRKTRAGRPEFVEEHGSGLAGARAWAEQSRGKERSETEGGEHTGRVRTAPRTLYSPDHLAKRDEDRARMPMVRRVDSALKTPPDSVLYQRPRQKAGKLGRLTLEVVSTQRLKLFHTTEIGMGMPSDPCKFTRAVEQFTTRHLWHEYVTSELASAGIQATMVMVERDVDVFFKDTAYGMTSQVSRDQADYIAGKLLRLALDCGSLNHVESILLWKSAVDSLNLSDVSATVAAFPILADRDAGRALRLCLDLFQTSTYRNQPERARRRLDMDLLVHIVDAAPQRDTANEYETYVKEWMRPPDCDKDGNLRMNTLCRELNRSGNLAAAVHVLYQETKRQGQLGSRDLFKELWHSTMAEGSLSRAAKLMRLHLTFDSQDDFFIQTDRFIQLCAGSGALQVLRTTFKRPLRDDDFINRLSRTSCIHLRNAFVHNEVLFGQLHRRCPGIAQEDSATSQSSARAAALRFTWKSTQNYGTVKAQFIRQNTGLVSGGQDVAEDGNRQLRMAFCEIQIDANKTELAMETLAELSGCGSDCHAASLIALGFARAGKWQAFQQVIDVLKKCPDDRNWIPDATRVFNQALQLFSMSHAADETSALVREAVDDIGFVADQSTFLILLSCFVSQGKLELIKHWLSMPRTLQLDLRVTSRLVAALLKRWYFDARHSHVLVMWVCREMAELAPRIAKQDLLPIVEEAIGYDSRHLHGVNAPWMKHVIFARQAMLEASKETIPKPGWIWGKALYDHSSPKQPLSAGPDRADWNDLEKADFHELRSMYLTSPDQPDVDSGDKITETETLERKMLSELSRANYQSVLDAYSNSLDASGLPASPRVMEIATEASLRLTNRHTEADNILSAASKAGMNIYSAMGPLLIYRMNTMERMEIQHAKKLRSMVMRYYRANAESGWHVRHYVGTHAAHSMLQAGFPELAVNLLDTIFQSEWSAKQPFDLAALSVLLQCYRALNHMAGVRWVVRTVLDSDRLVEHSFIRVLKRAKRPKVVTPNDNIAYVRSTAHVDAQIDKWLDQCRQKRAQQLWESRVFGRKLVRLLARAVNNGGLLPLPGAENPAAPSRKEERRKRGLKRKLARRDIVVLLEPKEITSRGGVLKKS